MSSRCAFCFLLATLSTTHALQTSQDIAKETWWPAMFSSHEDAGADDKLADIDSDKKGDKVTHKKKDEHKATKKVTHKTEHTATGKNKGQFKETDKAIQSLRKAIDKFEKAEDKAEEKAADEAAEISKEDGDDDGDEDEVPGDDDGDEDDAGKVSRKEAGDNKTEDLHALGDKHNKEDVGLGWTLKSTNDHTKCSVADNNKLWSKVGIEDAKSCQSLCGEPCKAVFVRTLDGVTSCQGFAKCDETSLSSMLGDLYVKADSTEVDEEKKSVDLLSTGRRPAADAAQKHDKDDEDDEDEKRSERNLLRPAGDRTPPRMLVSAGCDGSGTILKHAHNLLMLHGIQTPAVNTGELVAEYGDIAQHGPGTGISGTSRVMAQMHKDFLKQDQTLLFKGTIGNDEAALLDLGLFKMGTKVVEVTRRNELDQVVCMIKDCFGKHMGHPVMGGKESDLCIARRKGNPVDYKAYVNAETLVRNIRTHREIVRNTTSDLEGIGYTVNTFSAEDLLDFEFDEDQVNTAQFNWKHLLKAWGVHPRVHLIRQYLLENVGTRVAPHKHKDTMYNFASVKGALKEHEGLLSMLRE